MTYHQSSSSPPLKIHASSNPNPERQQNFKVFEYKKVETFPGSKIETSVTLNFKKFQANLMGCETHTLCKVKQQMYIKPC